MDHFQSKQLREERAGLVADLNAMAAKVKDEDRTFSAEELETYDKKDQAQKDLEERIKTVERIEGADSLRLALPSTEKRNVASRIVTPRDGENAIRAWALSAAGFDHLVTDTHRDAADKMGVNLHSTTLNCKLSSQPETRGQTVGTDSEGGYTANDAMVVGLDEAQLAFGGMRRAARVVRTADGNPIRWATLDDTTNQGAIVAENADTTSTDVAFGAATLNAYKYTSGVYPVSVELIQDSSLNISGLVGEALGTRLARIHNKHFTDGDGTSKPTGVEVTSAKGADADATATVSYDDLVDLMHSVDPLYRNSPNCAWMFNDSSLAYLRKMVDGDSRPLWQAGVASGAPDTILGKPYIVNNDCENIATGKKSLLFGDFGRYIIRDVSDISVMVLRERWAEKLAVGFIAFSRNDGLLLNANAVKHLLQP